MKFRVTMKDPDTLHDAISQAVKDDLVAMTGLTDEEREVLQEHREEAVGKVCGKWFEYSEYLCVEIDTEAQTCVVVPT